MALYPTWRGLSHIQAGSGGKHLPPAEYLLRLPAFNLEVFSTLDFHYPACSLYRVKMAGLIYDTEMFAG